MFCIEKIVGKTKDGLLVQILKKDNGKPYVFETVEEASQFIEENNLTDVFIRDMWHKKRR